MADTKTSADADTAGPDRVRVHAVETLSEHWRRLEKAHFTYRRRDGSTQELAREVYRNGEGAAVLPFDPRRGTVLLIRQFRIAARLNGEPGWLVEVPAGVVEDGLSPAETARRELEQETGHRLREVQPAGFVYPSPGATSERIHLFLGQYDPAERPGEGGGLAEEGEEIEVVEMPLAEAWAMVGSGAIVDGKTVLLLQHLMLATLGASAARTRG